MNKSLWFTLGLILLVVAYIGIFVPGLPWSTPAVGAAFCFTKSSKRMHDWIHNHRIFGPFLSGWQDKKIFPTKFKYFMICSMSVSLIILWFTTYNINAIIGTGLFMLLVAIWAWRYPGSEQDYETRVKENKRVAWLK